METFERPFGIDGSKCNVVSVGGTLARITQSLQSCDLERCGLGCASGWEVAPGERDNVKGDKLSL